MAAQNLALRAKALGRLPGYGLISARISLQLKQPNVEVAMFARNLADKKYLVRTFADTYTSLGLATAFAGEPRTYGAEVTFRF